MSSNKSLEKYLELYSKYVEERVHVHNYHIRFRTRLGLESYYRLREHLRQLPALEKEMLRTAKLAVKEQKEIELQAKRDRIAARKAKKNKKNVDVSE